MVQQKKSLHEIDEKLEIKRNKRIILRAVIALILCVGIIIVSYVINTPDVISLRIAHMFITVSTIIIGISIIALLSARSNIKELQNTN